MDTDKHPNYTEAAAKIKALLIACKNHSKTNEIFMDSNDILHIDKLPFSISNYIKLEGFDIDARLQRSRSPLQNDYVDLDKINIFFESISKSTGLQLNHIGFCYPESNIANEKNMLADFCLRNQLDLYYEQVYGFDPWFFVGSEENKESPMLEFLPTSIIPPDWEKSKDYWLPQIQIDIDTGLTGDQIAQIHNNIFGSKPNLQTLFASHDSVIVYRLRLGVLDGININLDIGTSCRDVKNYRENVLVVCK